jgi:catechol 2,3-dioxygenase-like lactoylglutathione lyase family enzyme
MQLGRFLELSLATPDIRASLDFYVRLGFSQAPTGDAWPHAYAAVSDGRLVLGLHEVSEWTTALTFVRPDLLRALESLEELDVALEIRRVATNEFNQIGWLDPSGHLVRLLEARTFSPMERDASLRPLCGYFAEIGLACSDLEVSKAYWEFLGFVGLDEQEPLPHIACTSDGINLGLYDPSPFRRPALRYESDDVAATLASLASRGITPAPRASATLGGSSGTVLTAPEGTPVWITPSAA